MYRYLEKDKQTPGNLLPTCFCYFAWECKVLYSLQLAICFTSFFPFSLDQTLGYGEGLLKLLEIRNFYSCWHIADHYFFCTAISQFFFNYKSRYMYSYNVHVRIMMKNKVMHWCISISLQCYIIYTRTYGLTICRFYLYTRSNI